MKNKCFEKYVLIWKKYIVVELVLRSKNFFSIYVFSWKYYDKIIWDDIVEVILVEFIIYFFG